MTRYVSRLGGDPEATYRTIDIASRVGGADSHALVGVMYDELVAACRAAAHAAGTKRFEVKSAKVTRALTLLFALESGLDFARGGEVSHTLQRLYAGARAELTRASLGHDPAPFLGVADTMAGIAGAWREMRAAA